MNRAEEIVKELAEKYGKNPDEMINIFENIFKDYQGNKGYMFLETGIALNNLSYYRLALVFWNKAIKYFTKERNIKEIFSCYFNIGNTHAVLEEFEKAIEYFERALEASLEIKNRSEEVACYGNIGVAYSMMENYKEAIEYFKKALEIAREIGDKAGESKCYTNMGNVYYGLGNLNKAIKYHEMSLEIDITIGDKAGESNCYINLGIIYCNSRDFSKAKDYIVKGLEIVREIYDKQGELKCYGNLGILYENLENFNKAIEYYKKALEITIEINDKKSISSCYGNLGNSYYGLGKFKKATEYYMKALETTMEIGSRELELSCYVNLGNSYIRFGNFKKSIEYFGKALEIAGEICDRQGESQCLIGKGVIYLSQGNFRKSIEYWEKALTIKREIGNKAGEPNCYTNIGNAYWYLGDFKKAIEYNEKSLEIAIEFGMKLVESTCYGNIGLAHYSLGDFNKAIEYYEKSLEINREIGNRLVEAACYVDLGIVYDNKKDFNKAIEYYEKSLEINREIGNRSGESFCYGNLGVTYRRLKNFNKAIKYQERSLEIAIEIGDLEGERLSNYNLATIYGEYLNKPEIAYDYCVKSIELLEKIAREIIEEEHKIRYIARTIDVYQYIVPLCIKLKRENKSFEFLERGKSRAFLELLATTEIRSSLEKTPELIKLFNEEETYLIRLREIQTRHTRQKKVTMEPDELDKILQKLTLLYKKIEKFDPEYVFLRSGKPLSLDELQGSIINQKKDIVLLEYFITKGKIFIFVVSSRTKKLKIEEVSISQEKFSEYIENYWQSVVRYPEFNQNSKDWLILSNYLIEPVSKYINIDDLVYFVPYGILHYIPLHALELKGEPMIVNHPTTYLPSASIIKFCEKKGTKKFESCVSIGLDFEEEAEEISKLFKGEFYVGNKATKENVINKCTEKDIIHLSCHGIFNNSDPLSSGVVLYGNEMLTAREIFNLKLKTELVTLSACDTGINDRSYGDEMVGLTRAILYAGAPSVMVSLWQVDARSIKELMLEFYKLLKKGEEKAIALQKSQVIIMEKYSHPYFWSPFILVGDWK